MSDPERLLDQGSSPEARLLASAVDEPPPPDLLGRTLDRIAMAAPPAAVVGAVAGTAARSGGLLVAAGIGAALGLLVVGGLELASRRAAPPEARPLTMSTMAPIVHAPPPASPPTPLSPSARTTSETVPAPSAPRPLTLAAELSLLDEARTALRAGDPVGARAWLDRYAREIPRGQLAREAALLRAEVEATIDAGATDP